MDVKLPNLGEGADSGTVVALFVKEGDRIKADQPLLELESEKAVASIPSPAAGVVGRIFVKAGDKIGVGQRILVLAVEGEVAPAAPEPAKSVSAPATAPGAPAQPASAAVAESFSPSGAEPVASPSIRKLAAELGIDLTRVRGSERGGRITMDDLRAYIQRLQALATQPQAAPSQPASKPAAEPVDFSKWGPVSIHPMSLLRKVISRRMAENWNAIPHVTQFDEADVTGLLALRKQYAPAYEQQGARLTLTGFVLQAVAATLKKHPIFNTSLDEAAEAIVYKAYFHIGIAVDTEAGLIVPVIRDVDKKSLLELSKELEELARKARERKVTADELKGGTFTISNQGGIGGAHFTPIVNKPEVAILGLGRGAVKAVVKDGQVVPRTLLPLAISYDHRVIDGGSAARFTVDLVQALEGFSEAEVRLA